jgi:hypothetical protein
MGGEVARLSSQPASLRERRTSLRSSPKVLMSPPMVTRALNRPRKIARDAERTRIAQ